MLIAHRYRYPSFWRTRIVPQGAVEINASHPLSFKLVGCWLDNSPTNANLATGVNSTLVGAPPGAVSPYTMGTGFKLNGTTQGFNTNFSHGSQAGFTIAHWWFTGTATIAARLSASSHTDVDNAGYQIRLNGTSPFAMDVGNGTTFAIAFSPALSGGTPQAATLYNAVGVYNNVNVVCYLNGVGGSSVALAGPMTPGSNAIGIGFNPAYNGDFTAGIFGPTMAWNRALSAAEVMQLYASPFCMLQPAYSGPLGIAATAAVTTRFDRFNRLMTPLLSQ